MDDQETDKLLEESLELKKKEKELTDSIESLSRNKNEQEQLIKMQTSILLNVAELSEKLQVIESNREKAKSDLTDLKNELLCNQTQINEISKIAQQMTKKEGNEKIIDQPRKSALLVTELLQDHIAKLTSKCLNAEDMSVDKSGIDEIAADLKRIIAELKKRNVIGDSTEDTIRKNHQEIMNLLK